MTKIDQLVNRFLTWPVPADVKALLLERWNKRPNVEVTGKPPCGAAGAR